MISLETARKHAKRWPVIGSIGEYSVIVLAFLLLIGSAPYLMNEIIAKNPRADANPLSQGLNNGMRTLSALPAVIVINLASMLDFTISPVFFDRLPHASIDHLLSAGNLLLILLAGLAAGFRRLKQMGEYYRSEVRKYDEWQQQKAWEREQGLAPPTEKPEGSTVAQVKEINFSDTFFGKVVIGVVAADSALLSQKLISLFFGG